MRSMYCTYLIRQMLTKHLAPTTLEIFDETLIHIGHKLYEEGKKHYAIKIASDAFKGKKLIECHRMIYDALDSLLKSHLHALRIKIL